MPILVALSACPRDAADAIARALVDEHLAACVSALPGARSTYRWNGAIETADETVLVIKTTRDRFDALKVRFAALHPYEVPELVAFAAADGFEAYIDWVRAECGTR